MQNKIVSYDVDDVDGCGFLGLRPRITQRRIGIDNAAKRLSPGFAYSWGSRNGSWGELIIQRKDVGVFDGSHVANQGIEDFYKDGNTPPSLTDLWDYVKSPEEIFRDLTLENKFSVGYGDHYTYYWDDPRTSIYLKKAVECGDTQIRLGTYKGQLTGWSVICNREANSLHVDPSKRFRRVIGKNTNREVIYIDTIGSNTFEKNPDLRKKYRSVNSVIFRDTIFAVLLESLSGKPIVMRTHKDADNVIGYAQRYFDVVSMGESLDDSQREYFNLRVNIFKLLGAFIPRKNEAKNKKKNKGLSHESKRKKEKEPSKLGIARDLLFDPQKGVTKALLAFGNSLSKSNNGRVANIGTELVDKIASSADGRFLSDNLNNAIYDARVCAGIWAIFGVVYPFVVLPIWLALDTTNGNVGSLSQWLAAYEYSSMLTPILPGGLSGPVRGAYLFTRSIMYSFQDQNKGVLNSIVNLSARTLASFFSVFDFGFLLSPIPGLIGSDPLLRKAVWAFPTALISGKRNRTETSNQDIDNL